MKKTTIGLAALAVVLAYGTASAQQIDVKIGGDTTVIGRQVLEGSGMVQNEAPAQSIVKLAYEKFRTQLEISPGAGSHYIAVDNKHGPFANINLDRKSVVRERV